MPDIRDGVRNRALRKEELLILFPELAADEEALLDTLDGIDDLDRQIASLLRRSREEDAFAEARGALIAKDREQKKRHEERSDRLKALAMWAAQQAQIRKIMVPGCSASVAMPKKGPVIILAAEAVPDEYCKIERTPRKTEIGEALDRGEKINYAKRGDPVPFWVIR